MKVLTIILAVLFSLNSYLGEEPLENSADYVQFTLHNSSAKSIPLKIPGVMNPNLSPFSNSGVSLEIGQKIYFNPKGKRNSTARKEVLLVVTEVLQDQKIDVAKLIKERKKELSI